MLSVEQLRITPEGASAQLADGQTALDMHNQLHADSHYIDSNAISFGFTSHYARMRERFGDHMCDGVAGENILIEVEEAVDLADIVRGLAVRSASTGETVYFGDLHVAPPCVEFSRFALQDEMVEENRRTVKDTLQFLNDGMRGFYATPVIAGNSQIISVGDHVYVRGIT